MGEFDLVIRGGTIVDGTGQRAFQGDVAIRNGQIADIGHFAGTGTQEISAAGCIVTPGFVDIHTHYDGQAIWSSHLSPSSAHGVTTVVAGNCGVGFAPCRPEDRELLKAAMEGVEDIPEIVMTTGLTWEWESFPEYLDALERRRWDIDLAALVPHSALRVFVMGERGANREPANDADLSRMAELMREALEAGAIGFATSSAIFHRRIDGEYIPSFRAGEDELQAIARTISEAGHGIFQMSAQDELGLTDATSHIDMLGRLSIEQNIPVTFTLTQPHGSDEKAARWRSTLRSIGRLNDTGAEISAQFFPRPVGMFVGHNLSTNPFALTRAYAEIAHLPLEERIEELARPATRERILNEVPSNDASPIYLLSRSFDLMFETGDPPCYEPDPGSSIAAIAGRRGLTPAELAYDLLLENGGKAMLYIALSNYADRNLDYVMSLLADPNVVLGLGDGGAHYGLICDSSYPTYVLSYLARDRAGARISVEAAVQALAHKPARVMGLDDRGLIAKGLKGDLNVIDFEKLQVRRPDVKFDLPGGGRRVDQASVGFRYTIVNGEIIVIDDQRTGSLPGRLVRHGRPATRH